MKETLETLEKLGFYRYEDAALIPIIQELQYTYDSMWLKDGKYQKVDLPLLLTDEIIENDDYFLYLYHPLPLHRCFLIDREDLYEFPQEIFEYQYIFSSLQKSGVNIDISSLHEYEDVQGNLRLVTNLGEFLVCSGKCRSNSMGNFYINWQNTTANVLLMLNELLEKVSSSERFYVLNEAGQEETITVALLDSSLIGFFRSLEGLEEQSLPKPVDQYFEKYLVR